LPAHAVAPAIYAPREANERLRASLNALFDVRQSFLASSGRTALYLLLAALRDRAQGSNAATERNEVVLPAYTCPSVAKVILEADLEPRLVDIDPRSMVMLADELVAAIGPQTLAVMLIHPFGIAHDVEPALTLAQQSGAVLIEDAAQSMGARLNGRYAGTRGHYGLFSLGPGKPLSAGGGGIVCVGDLGDMALAEKGWRQLPDAGRLADYVALARLAAFQSAFQPLGWWMATRAGAQKAGDDEANWGFSLSGLTAAQAGIADRQLKHLDTYNEARRANAHQMIDGLTGLSGITLPGPQQTGIDFDGAFFLRLPLLFDDPQRCLAVHDALQAQGIGAGRMYKKTLPALFPTLHGHFLGADAVASGLLTLPTHHHLRPDDVAAIIETVSRVSS
jgi:dTDP-4-amino-4,6-dideoxygalactose transaminase